MSSSDLSSFHVLINGNLVAGAQMMDVVNPATEELVAECPRCSAEQIDSAVEAAHAASPGWSATPLHERRKALISIAERVEGHADELARILTQEQGKPLAEAKREVHAMAAFFRHFATLDIPVKVLETSKTRRVEAHRKPLGVIAAIIPWNYPIMLLGFKLPPALLAGNTVVLKPAATTPLATLRFGQLIRDLLPPGVLNVVADANDLGNVLTSHPLVRKISFTGSTATGSRVMASAAGSLKRVTLELGGNDAAIVLADVDVAAVAAELFMLAFRNSGQVCTAVKRLYVHESIYDAMCNELAGLAEAAVVGNGLQEGTQFGPLQNQMQYTRVSELIEDARSCGTIIAGGTRPQGNGYFIRPTVVRDIAEGSRLVDEEQFGPVLPVIKFSDPEDAVKRANNSTFGLGGSIWSSNIDTAYALADKLDAGTVWINKHMDLGPGIPFGGSKQSGIGSELGADALAEVTQLKIINVAV